ncbi:MAG: hypothetical protein ACYDAG_19090, partial [Chloroflexota bacterium]
MIREQPRLSRVRALDIKNRSELPQLDALLAAYYRAVLSRWYPWAGDVGLARGEAGVKVIRGGERARLVLDDLGWDSIALPPAVERLPGSGASTRDMSWPDFVPQYEQMYALSLAACLGISVDSAATDLMIRQDLRDVWSSRLLPIFGAEALCCVGSARDEMVVSIMLQ